MRNRLGLLLLMSLAAGLSGCAATRMDGPPSSGLQAWSLPPAPPQRTIATTEPAAPVSVFEDNAPKPTGLAKYFPGLQRTQTPQAVASTRYRPTWFGLRPNPDANKPAQPTTYMTDARAALSRPIYGSEPASLPIALQVPAPASSSDSEVKPTNAEQPIPASSPAQTPAASDSDSSAPVLPGSMDKLAKPGDDEVNPLPPAIGSTVPAATVASRMPAVPPVDPQEPAKPGNPEPTAAPQPTPASAPASAPTPSPALSAPSDEKAVKAVPAPSNPNLPPGLPEATVPASYYASALVAQQAVGFKKLSECKVFASPQSVPAVAAKPSPQSPSKPQAKPFSQAVPTSLAKPSPQAKPSAQSCETSTGTTWQRPCLRRLIRRCCGLGEFADPPTAAPH